MNRVELLIQAMNDSKRPQSERDLAARSLRDISSTSDDPSEREAARRAAGLSDLLGLGPKPSVAPASKPAETPAASPETAKPKPEPAPEPTAADKGRLAKIARLAQVLAGAQTNIKELSQLLEPKTRQALGIDYTKEIKLKKIVENLMLAERRQYLNELAFQEQFQPIVIGSRTFHVDPAVRAEILAIRDRGAYTIRNCTKHKRERCKCFWDNARPELLAFRDKYGPGSDEYKAANAIWDELETMARNHVPGRNRPTVTQQLDDSNNSPSWLGRRKP